jgi:hypothetical protein
MRLDALALVTAEAREAHRGAQFPEFDFATLKRKSGWSTPSPAPPQLARNYSRNRGWREPIFSNFATRRSTRRTRAAPRVEIASSAASARPRPAEVGPGEPALPDRPTPLPMPPAGGPGTEVLAQAIDEVAVVRGVCASRPDPPRGHGPRALHRQVRGRPYCGIGSRSATAGVALVTRSTIPISLLVVALARS